MKIIIIILQAILNLVRKRRDLIANRSKIPPEYRDDVVVWYSPKKQRLTNYDVIESYAEDFTYWTINNTSITSAQKKIVIPAGTELEYVIAYRGFNASTDGFDIKLAVKLFFRILLPLLVMQAIILVLVQLLRLRLLRLRKLIIEEQGVVIFLLLLI